MSLEMLELSDEIVKALEDKGYEKATKIQEALIPVMLSGRDIMAGAQTGTGKTAGYALPILQALCDKEAERAQPRALIIVPTRELARQVHRAFEAYAKYLDITSVVLYGGVNIATQAKRLAAGCDVVVSTSGRLLEHIKQKSIGLKQIRFLVLDEADTILDMGFVKEVMTLSAHLPENRQNVLISATLSSAVKRLGDSILKHPKLIEVDSMGTSAALVEQVIHPVEKEQKLELLSYLIGSKNYHKVLVFVRKKFEADEVAKELNLSGLKTAVIHGDKTSGARNRALEDFKEEKVRVLVATDIAARGLDIPGMHLVINYDIPHVTGDFIHRIGRTGRAGVAGKAITLLSPSEENAMKDVERLMKKTIKREMIEGYEVIAPVGVKSAKKQSREKKKTDGAFGKRQKHSASAPTKKKRKVTKRDGFKQLDRDNAKKR